MNPKLPTAPKSAAPPIVHTCAIDDVALAALRAAGEAAPVKLRCNACDRPVAGGRGGSGLFMWARGEERRFDEPPLCPRCATAIGVTALSRWACESDGD